MVRDLIQPSNGDPPEEQGSPDLQAQLDEFRLVKPNPVAAIHVEGVPNIQGGLHSTADKRFFGAESIRPERLNLQCKDARQRSSTSEPTRTPSALVTRVNVRIAWSCVQDVSAHR
jgi:hypothetical protein